MTEIVELICDKFESSCKVHLFGATVISWIYKSEECLFLSSKTNTKNPSKAIRGGIPVVFPNFGPWEHGPQHGFARNQCWTLETAPTKLSNGEVQAVFKLTDSDATRAVWDHRFILLYTVTVGDSLKTEFQIENTGEKDFDFTCLLHTYFRVPDINKVTVSGLKNLSYIDKVKGGDIFTEDRELVTIGDNVDRVYKSTKDHIITGGPKNQMFVIRKDNLPDTVVWNPWAEKAAGMSDFGDDEYLNMICVEAGYVAERYVLQPNCTFRCGQNIEILPKAAV